MKLRMRFIGSIFGMLFAMLSYGQENFNIEQIAHVPYSENLSDIWGWVDEDGTEYAIVGTNSKTDVYSLADPSKPQLLHSAPGSNSIWRDIKTLGDYAYVTTDDGSDGIVIIDLSGAPNNITSTKFLPNVNGVLLEKCHNLYIDPFTQYMFLAGCEVPGVTAFNITTDPLIPRLINVVTTPYSHDVFVRDNLLFSSEIFDGQVAIYDIEDIMNPVLIGSAKTSNFFTHNAWSSDDNQFVFTTDEVVNGAVDAYDISDPSNPRRLDIFVPESIKGSGIVPHNTHWMNDFLITSWYSYGVVISDVSNPSSIVETGHFNTGENPDCWGVYPFLPSGLILASDIDNGFYVLQPNYQRGAFAEGLVSDADTGEPIFGASVTLLSSIPVSKLTDPQGNYLLGQLQEGTFSINFNHPDYESKTLSVDLNRGENQVLDVTLSKSPIFTQNILTIDAATGESIPNVEILLSKEGLDISGTTDAEGSLVGDYVNGDFTIVAGRWGYQYAEVEASFFADGELLIEMEAGYQDDFIFDNQWLTQTPNSRSEWVRAAPIGTTFGGQQSNPSQDVEGDLGNLCYVTGNGSGGAGAFDVDNGNSVLTSPVMELQNFQGATLEFAAWFFNEGGSGTPPNDAFKIYLNNGTDKKLITEFIENTGGWTETGPFRLADLMELSDNTSISFEAADEEATGHLVEAGLDAFFVNLTGSSSIEESTSTFNEEWVLYPNPVEDFLLLENTSFNESSKVSIFTFDGRLLYSSKQVGSKFRIEAPTESGIYFIQIKSGDGRESNLKFVKI